MPLTPDFQELLLSMLGHTKLPVLGFDYRAASSDRRCCDGLCPNELLAIQAFPQNMLRHSHTQADDSVHNELLQTSFLFRSSTFQTMHSHMVEAGTRMAQEGERI